MLKELQKLFRRKGLMEQAVDDSLEMLKEDWEMFLEAKRCLRESDTADMGINIEEKENDPNFTGDMEALLRTEIDYEQESAFYWLKNELIEKYL